ncbi:hypothetical protein [Salicibibacter kimchii]|uniref:hypothetical protein n=1 Tax=Salicibibacter kimchii TaxID=2099786 RepID=UPI0013584A25|nr:hypothetical protein [Salicibibacter kimchii]
MGLSDRMAVNIGDAFYHRCKRGNQLIIRNMYGMYDIVVKEERRSGDRFSKDEYYWHGMSV